MYGAEKIYLKNNRKQVTTSKKPTTRKKRHTLNVHHARPRNINTKHFTTVRLSIDLTNYHNTKRKETTATATAKALHASCRGLSKSQHTSSKGSTAYRNESLTCNTYSSITEHSKNMQPNMNLTSKQATGTKRQETAQVITSKKRQRERSNKSLNKMSKLNMNWAHNHTIEKDQQQQYNLNIHQVEALVNIF
ncbi:hypothetical protein ACHAWO_008099 [Cyclotella atomus]|uniref:Uncharacterized protein n=1 Tax=Cyclotella atomus TaxID=382360 RepID=A0ABD3NUS0_9STRA